VIQTGFRGDLFAALEARIFDRPWQADSFSEEPNRLAFWWQAGDGCAGYVTGSVVAGEAELWRIAVAPEARRRGIAMALWKAFSEGCEDRGATAVFLEVSALNVSALAFYRHLGFSETGRRKAYYGAQEDAILMQCPLRRDPTRRDS